MIYGRIWKEMSVASSKVLFRLSPGETEENEKPSVRIATNPPDIPIMLLLARAFTATLSRWSGGGNVVQHIYVTRLF
jgi:hypothetical protein